MMKGNIKKHTKKTTGDCFESRTKISSEYY